jgi:hypothetical protein
MDLSNLVPIFGILLAMIPVAGLTLTLTLRFAVKPFVGTLAQALRESGSLGGGSNPQIEALSEHVESMDPRMYWSLRMAISGSRTAIVVAITAWSNFRRMGRSSCRSAAGWTRRPLSAVCSTILITSQWIPEANSSFPTGATIGSKSSTKRGLSSGFEHILGDRVRSPLMTRTGFMWSMARHR